MVEWDPFADPADLAATQAVPATSLPKEQGSRAAAEKRFCPDDGKFYTHAELAEKFRAHYSDDDIETYWRENMQANASESWAAELSREIGTRQQGERQAMTAHLLAERSELTLPFFNVGDFVELLLCEGENAGSWVACQVLEPASSPDVYHVFIPAQPTLVVADAYVPNVPVSILREPLSPANKDILQEYYPVPRPELRSQVEAPVESVGWYPGKPQVEGRKLRVAVLHGTSSNAKIMGHQISRLRTTCGDRVEFVFLQGSIDSSTIPENPQYALMSKVFPGQTLYQFAYYAAGNGADYGNLDEVLETLQEQLRSHGPIDGVLGTGQGSNMCTLLAAQAACGQGVPLSFVIHFGGTPAAWAWRYPNLFSKSLRIPSFHTVGTEDPFLRGFACFASLYADPVLKNHSGDHRPIPRDVKEAGELCSSMLGFMETAAAAKGKRDDSAKPLGKLPALPTNGAFVGA